jgi:hypothetical protein
METTYKAFKKVQTVNLSRIPIWWNMGVEDLILWCVDNGYMYVVNDYGTGVQYHLSDVEQSFGYWLSFVER